MILCAITLNVNANDIDFKVKASQLKNDTIFLGYYYNGKPYVQDTIKLDKSGRGQLSKEKELKICDFQLFLTEKVKYKPV